MTSFNHYALGAVADWLHRTVAGLAPGGARLPADRSSGRGPTRRLTSRVGPPPHALRRRRGRAGSGRTAGSVCAWSCRSAPTAIVHVPGDERAGRGRPRHATSGRRPTRAAATRALPAEPTVRDVIDHEPTWQQVVAAAVEPRSSPTRPRLRRAPGARTSTRPPARSPTRWPPRGLAERGEALRARLAAVLANCDAPADTTRPRLDHPDGYRCHCMKRSPWSVKLTFRPRGGLAAQRVVAVCVAGPRPRCSAGSSAAPATTAAAAATVTLSFLVDNARPDRQAGQGAGQGLPREEPEHHDQGARRARRAATATTSSRRGCPPAT